MSLPAFRDLFTRHRTRATGLWKVGREAVRTIYLDQGDVVYATSTHPHDRLTHLLVERGKLTQAQLDYALVNLNPAMSVGKNLIEMGFITQRDLLEVARALVERVVRACLAAGDAPAFEARELDAATVRLPFDTPALLLGCALGLGDREAVLDELGPLNQVVVLEGRRLLEMSLPVDLGRLTSLLDGSRTLLELGRETGVEPFRLGAFALFLREMGWARLHALPPLDRGTLELALEPAAPLLTGPLPIQHEPAGAPDLMEALPAPEAEPPLTVPVPLEEEPAPAEEALPIQVPGLSIPEGDLPQAEEALPLAEEVPTPTGELLPQAEEVPPPAGEAADLPPAPPEAPAEEVPVTLPAALLGAPAPEEPPLTVQAEAPEAAPGEAEEAPAEGPRSRGPWLPLAALLVVLAGTWGAYRLLARKRVPPQAPRPAAPSPAPAPAPAQVAPPAPAPTAAPAPTTAPAPAAEPAQAPAPRPEPPAAAAPPSRAERLKAIAQGDWPRVLQQGEAHRRTVQAQWTLRLEIACQVDTVQHAVGLLKDQDPDLFVLPMAMRDGRTCYQVFLGAYASEAAARDAARRLPAPFLAEGNRPKPFRVAQIPDRQ